MKNFFKKLMSSKSQSKYFSETVQRVGKNNAGFSLVELIVVIAIMAILAAVAVIGISIYVPKAQQAADKQLVSDVEQALNLYYQSHAGNMTGGYVIISTSGTTAGGSGIDAMTDMFGGSYIDNKLAYDGWTGGAGMIDVLSGYTPEQIALITNSSYLTDSNTESLMDAVNVMTNLASGVIAGSNLDNAERNLKLVLGAENAAPIIETLKKHELMGNTTAISNMLVNAMADSMKDNEALQIIMNDYAAAFAYAEKYKDVDPNADAALKQMQENLKNVSMDALTDEDDALDMLYVGFEDQKFEGFNEYIDAAWKDGTLEEDQKALTNMLGAVKEISGNFTDKESLMDDKLFTSEGVMGQVNNYVNAVNALAGLDQADLDVLKGAPDNAIVVFIAADGVISVYPGEAQAS